MATDEQDTDSAVHDDEPTDSGPRTKKVRIDLDATKVQPIAAYADNICNPSGDDGSTAQRSPHPPPPPVSFTATLPSTGLDVLLIGRTDLCRPLAESMLGVTFDRQRVVGAGPSGGRKHGKNKRPRRGRGDTAIEALRRHLCRSSAAATTGGSRGGGIGSFGLADAVRARHVRLVESLSDLTDSRTSTSTAGGGNGRKGKGESQIGAFNKEQNDITISGNSKDPRVDHAVIILTPSDPFSSTRLRQTVASIHPDYAIEGRVTVVCAVGGSGDSTSGGPAKAADPDLERLLEDVERGTASKLLGSTKGGATCSNGKISKGMLFAASVPVLRCNLKDSHSRLAVARMILQRTKMGSRGCMGADDGLDVVVSNTEHKPNINGAANNASGEGDDSRVLDTGPKSGIGGTKGGISPLFFSSML